MNESKPILWVSFMAGCGIMLAKYFPLAPLFLVIVILINLLAACFFLKRCWMPWLLLTLSLFVFWFYAEIRIYSVKDNHITQIIHQEIPDETRQLKLNIIEQPRLRLNQSGRKRLEFYARVLELRADDHWRDAEGKILVRIYSGSNDSSASLPDFQYGDILQVTGYLMRPAKPKNHGQFDYGNFLRSKETYFLIEINKRDILHLGQKNRYAWKRTAYVVREFMLEALSLGMESNPEMTALMSGMLFGYTDGIAHQVEEKFRVTGTLHLFAVSGQNVAVISAMLLFILQLCGLIRWKCGLFILPFVFIFCQATGMESSAARAFLMCSVILLGWKLYRPISVLNSVGLSAIILWIWNPHELFNLGFQLSFFVVLGLVLGVKPLVQWLIHWAVPDPWIPQSLINPLSRRMFFYYKIICSLFATSLCAWLSSLPLTMYHFHLFAPITILSNILIVPLASIVVILSVVSVVSALFSTLLVILVNKVNWLILSTILSLVSYLSEVPNAYHYMRLGYMKEPNCQSQIFVMQTATGVAPVIVELKERGNFILLGPGDEATWRWITDPLRRKLGIDHWQSIIRIASTSRSSGAYDTIKDEMKAYDSTINEVPEVQIVWPEKKNTLNNRQQIVRLNLDGKKILYAGELSYKLEQKIVESIENLENLDADMLIQGESHTRANFSKEWLEAVSPDIIIRTSRTFGIDEALGLDFWQYCRANNITIICLNETGGVRVRTIRVDQTYDSQFKLKTFIAR